MCTSGPHAPKQLKDMDLINWFTTDSLSDNLRTSINRVVLTPEPEVSPIAYSSDSKYIFFICHHHYLEDSLCVFKWSCQKYKSFYHCFE